MRPFKAGNRPHLAGNLPALEVHRRFCRRTPGPFGQRVLLDGTEVIDRGEEYHIVTDLSSLTFQAETLGALLIKPDGTQVALPAGSPVALSLSPGDQRALLRTSGFTAKLLITRVVWSMADVAPEAGEAAEFHVVRTDGGSQIPITFSTEDGTASAPGDYTSSSGTRTLTGTGNEQVNVATDSGSGGKSFDLKVEVA